MSNKIKVRPNKKISEQFFPTVGPKGILNRVKQSDIEQVKSEMKEEVFKTVFAAVMMLQKLGLSGFDKRRSETDKNRILSVSQKLLEIASKPSFWQIMGDTRKTELQLLEEIKKLAKETRDELIKARKFRQEIHRMLENKGNGRPEGWSENQKNIDRITGPDKVEWEE